MIEPWHQSQIKSWFWRPVFCREYHEYHGDGSKCTTWSFTIFHRRIEFSYSRPLKVNL